MIHISDEVLIDESELDYQFIRSSGPGGQNVNKVSTAVQLRFNAAGSRYLTPEIMNRLAVIAGKRMTSDGVVIITAQRHRTQERNRRDALERLISLIRAASMPPKKRRPTRPTAASKNRRLEAKKRRSATKRERTYKPEND